MDNFGSQVTNTNAQVTAQTQQTQAQTQVVNQMPVQQPVVTVQPAQSNQALFTQEQLNSIISGRVNPLNQKIQELNTQLAQAQQLSQSYLNELTGFKNRESAVKAGVPSQFVDFAVFEASKLAVNGKSFDDAIKEYVASNGQLFGVSNQSGQTQQTTSPVSQQVTQVTATPAQNTQIQQTNVPVNNNTASVQYGATSMQNAGNPASVNNIDSQVDAFLKSHNLKR